MIPSKLTKWLSFRIELRFLDEDRIIRMIENESLNGGEAYSALEMLEDVRAAIFTELNRGQAVDAYRRNIQRAYVELFSSQLQALDEEQKRNDEVIISSIIPLMRVALNQLNEDIRSRRYRTSDKMSRIH